MATGSPSLRVTPDRAAAAYGPGAWGNQPSGPLVAVTPGRLVKPRRGAQLGHVGHVGNSQIANTDTGAGPRPLGLPLPKAATLDYAHKLTTTTLLLGGVIGYLLFRPRRGATVLRQLAGRHVAPTRG